MIPKKKQNPRTHNEVAAAAWRRQNSAARARRETADVDPESHQRDPGRYMSDQF
jgi:hypothetical protein